ncbi:IS481 family transposase, partial [Nocardia sp. CWNU-33]|uniref:IS481 family transposase n=1 Tax=Nocardia sp. CWNU-33 TaxID=3392117 RepID=UPI00398ED353
MSHRNAPLSELGRLRLARCVVDEGWPLRRAAERFQVSATTASRWAGRYRLLGPAGMVDRSSRPHHSPRRTPTRTERRIIKVRVLRRWGPARIAYLLGLHPSTAHRVLTRYRLARLRWLDRATSQPVRRYEHDAPDDLIHIDVKKLGKIPDGGGWRKLGRSAGNRNSQAHKLSGVNNVHGNPTHGYHYLHTALDDHSRLAYTELLGDERKDTAAAFWARANAWFTANCIITRKVLTDTGSCYRSRSFAEALGPVVHKRTRPYRPQTNGKVCEYFRDARIRRSDPGQGMTAVSFVRFVDRLDAGVHACA